MSVRFGVVHFVVVTTQSCLPHTSDTPTAMPCLCLPPLRSSPHSPRQSSSLFRRSPDTTSKMDPSRSRRPSLPRLTTNVPPACRSSASLPPVPLVTKSIDAKLQEPPCKPTLFLDDKKDDENIAPLLRYAADVKPPVVEQSTEEPPITKTKTSYYDDAFAFRGAHNSPQERVAQDSVVVAELKTNYKVCP